jgi:hypothetical protein
LKCFEQGPLEVPIGNPYKLGISDAFGVRPIEIGALDTRKHPAISFKITLRSFDVVECWTAKAP